VDLRRSLDRASRASAAEGGGVMDHEDLRLDCMASPLGPLLVVCDREGHLRALDFGDHEARMRRLLSRHCGQGRYTLREGRAAPAVTAAIEAFFDGDLCAIDAVPVRTGGTVFQKRVWAALRRIPAGTTTTYSRVARDIQHVNASRAVGLANGANRVCIIVPCHRVIGADGTLTGYGGGMHRKRWLLEHEDGAARTFTK
jgi:O-6-methylguanine DNA methyltransferase